jgi:N-acetylglucosamine-6-phosphate deacetylase
VRAVRPVAPGARRALGAPGAWHRKTETPVALIAMPTKLPGFVDLQVNGFAGVDFNDPSTSAEAVAQALDAMRSTGVTRCLPTLITSSFETFATCAAAVLGCGHEAVAGLHMEGPYISPLDGFRGAHPREHVAAASIDDFKRRQDAASGRIRLVTLAPEATGALSLIEHLVRQDVRVAIGHTSASSSEIADAIAAGATLSTHLGNGCASMLPRHPNVIWDQLASDELLASFIVDGHHLPQSTVRAMIRAKGPSRTILVTDAIAAAGSPPGRYRLGSLEVELDPSGRVAAPGASNLAGSAVTMDRAVANTIRFTGLPLEDVLPMASTIPAAFIGIEPAGELRIGGPPNAPTFHLA